LGAGGKARTELDLGLKLKAGIELETTFLDSTRLVAGAVFESAVVELPDVQVPKFD
jgi:hypothetical protein